LASASPIYSAAPIATVTASEDTSLSLPDPREVFRNQHGVGVIDF